MPYELVKGENWKRTLKFDIPETEVAEKYEESLKQASRLFAMPGFRPGRVPRQIIEKRLSKQLTEDTLENLRQDKFDETSKELKLNLLGRPKFDETGEYEKGQSYKFEAEFEIEPEFELPKYKGLELKRHKTDATEEDIQQELDSFQFRSGTWLETEGHKALKNDAIFADMTLLQDGKVIKKEENRRFTVRENILKEYEIEDMTSKFTGAVAGEEKEIIVKLREDIEGVEVGQECTLKFEIKSVHALTLPPIDGEFAKKHDFETLEEMKLDLRYKIAEHKTKGEDRRFKTELMNTVAGLCEFDLPENLLQMQSKHTFNRRKTEFLRMGINIEEFEDGKHKESFFASAVEDARQILKVHFVIEKIAEKEKIFATESEYMREIDEMAAQYGISRQKMAKVVETEDIGDQVRSDILERKVMELITKKAKIEEIDAPAPQEAAGEVTEEVKEAPATETEAAGEAAE